MIWHHLWNLSRFDALQPLCVCLFYSSNCTCILRLHHGRHMDGSSWNFLVRHVQMQTRMRTSEHQSCSYRRTIWAVLVTTMHAGVWISECMFNIRSQPCLQMEGSCFFARLIGGGNDKVCLLPKYGTGLGNVTQDAFHTKTFLSGRCSSNIC